MFLPRPKYQPVWPPGPTVTQRYRPLAYTVTRAYSWSPAMPAALYPSQASPTRKTFTGSRHPRLSNPRAGLDYITHPRSTPQLYQRWLFGRRGPADDREVAQPYPSPDHPRYAHLTSGPVKSVANCIGSLGLNSYFEGRIEFGYHLGSKSNVINDPNQSSELTG